jgi:hypothetical protein
LTLNDSIFRIKRLISSLRCAKAYSSGLMRREDGAVEAGLSGALVAPSGNDDSGDPRVAISAFALPE